MADYGTNLHTLIQSLSGLGAVSSDLANISLTGDRSRVLPLVNYSDFSKHIFFGDALRRFRNSLTYIQNSYPIGLSAGDVASLCAENIFRVDKWKKEAKGFDLWFLDQLSQTSTVTASSTNINGENVPLIWVRRGATNTITGSQTAVVDSISARAVSFEEENINIIEQTPGSTNDHIVFASTSEQVITRAPRLKNMLPEILFYGDNNEILEKLLQSFGDVIDDLKVFIDQMEYIQVVNYDDYNRTPNKFLPILAKEYGIQLFQSSIQSAIESFFISSTSGSTTQEISYELWQRILNNYTHLVKTKGIRECLEAIARIYGIDHNLFRIDEYSLFKKPIQIRETEEVDMPVLFSTGDVYIQLPTGSVSAFDFSSSANFTIEGRISATSSLRHKLVQHPLYTIELSPSGQIVFSTTAGTSVSSNVSSISALAHLKDNFMNFAVSRTGDNVKVWIMSLTGTGSGSEKHVLLSSGVTSGVQSINFDSSAGASAFGTYFPGSGSFTGYTHEVRVWNVALEEEDLKEHTRNFESVSFNNSTANNSATFGSLIAHYRLKENIVLTGGYNFIVDSTTANNSATPVNFNTQVLKRYKVFPDQEKINKWYPSGLSFDNDKIRQDDPSDKMTDVAYLSTHFDPVNIVDREIKNTYQSLNIADLLGDPEDLYRHSYTGPFDTYYKDFLTRKSVSAELININDFIKAFDGFNDVLGGVFQFIKQFLPAKVNLISEGILVKDHLFQKSKIQRESYSSLPISVTAMQISNHFLETDTAASAATTSTFQGYRIQNPIQNYIDYNLTSNSTAINLGKNKSTINIPQFSFSKVGKILPIEVSPSNPEDTEVEVTLSRILISPTASPSAFNGNINGTIRLLRLGRAFQTDKPALRFNFPSSSNSNNYFVAEIGNIEAGKGRILTKKDLIFVSDLVDKNVQIKLQLSQDIRGLSADSQSLSGTIGIVPIQITNLFNNATQILRIGIGNDPQLVDQLLNQGGVKIIS